MKVERGGRMYCNMVNGHWVYTGPPPSPAPVPSSLLLRNDSFALAPRTFVLNVHNRLKYPFG
eukprot:331611-Pyramimonas_sp.AAC.1